MFGELTDVLVEDVMKETRHTLRARSVVNAAGPWISKLLGDVTATTASQPVFSKGVQLVVPQIIDGYAVAL